MKNVVIYSPAKTSMQSGVAKTGHWVLEFETSQPKSNDPLMGWIGGGETQSQISLSFDTKEAAIKYAEDNELSYIIKIPKKRSHTVKSYSDNYAFTRREPWSH